MSYGTNESDRIPNSVHEAEPWRIHRILPDFTLEDVWALPATGGPDDFPDLLEMVASLDPAHAESGPARALWQLRDRLGSWFDLDPISTADGEASDPAAALAIPGTTETSLAGRLPEDLLGTAAGYRFGALPFRPLYRTDREAASEMSNQTVHGVAHLAWVDQGSGRFQGRMAVYVKPRGRFGAAYMAAIKPFRHWIVYPALMGQFGRAWERRAA